MYLEKAKTASNLERMEYIPSSTRNGVVAYYLHWKSPQIQKYS
jgi:hypothetical protein